MSNLSKKLLITFVLFTTLKFVLCFYEPEGKKTRAPFLRTMKSIKGTHPIKKMKSISQKYSKLYKEFKNDFIQEIDDLYKNSNSSKYNT